MEVLFDVPVHVSSKSSPRRGITVAVTTAVGGAVAATMVTAPVVATTVVTPVTAVAEGVVASMLAADVVAAAMVVVAAAQWVVLPISLGVSRARVHLWGVTPCLYQRRLTS